MFMATRLYTLIATSQVDGGQVASSPSSAQAANSLGQHGKRRLQNSADKRSGQIPSRRSLATGQVASWPCSAGATKSLGQHGKRWLRNSAENRSGHIPSRRSLASGQVASSPSGSKLPGQHGKRWLRNSAETQSGHIPSRRSLASGQAALACTEESLDEAGHLLIRNSSPTIFPSEACQPLRRSLPHAAWSGCFERPGRSARKPSPWMLARPKSGFSSHPGAVRPQW